jgi:hypothetical protein
MEQSQLDGILTRGLAGVPGDEVELVLQTLSTLDIIAYNYPSIFCSPSAMLH